MGAFNAANQWFMLLMFFPGILEQVTLPMLSEQLGRNDKEKALKLLSASIKINVVVVYPLVVMGIVLSPLIMALYGNDFQDEWPTLVLVLLTASILSIQTPVGVLLQAVGKMWPATATSVVWAITFLVATFSLAQFGAVGLASARAVAYGVNGIVLFSYAFYMMRSIKLI